jgi:hypothetical protein
LEFNFPAHDKTEQNQWSGLAKSVWSDKQIVLHKSSF